MEKTRKIILYCSCLLVFIFAALGGIRAAQAAYFSFSPSDGVYQKAENFTVGVFVNTDVAINAVQGMVNFPTEYLEAVAVKNNNNSIIDLWIQKPSFSNAGNTGNVRFEGVVLSPGFVGSSGKIFDVVFRIKKEGAAELSFTEFAILANDGLATNLSVPNKKASFVFKGALPQEEFAEQKDIKIIQKKIKSVEEKIESMVQTPVQIPVQTPEVAPETEKGILGLWKILPKWVKFSVLTLVGIAAIILALIVIILGLIIIVWLWSYAWRWREKFNHWFNRTLKRIRNFFRRLFRLAEFAEKEMEENIKYAAHQIENDFREAEIDDSLKETLKNYLNSLKKIIRRFITRNKI